MKQANLLLHRLYFTALLPDDGLVGSESISFRSGSATGTGSVARRDRIGMGRIKFRANLIVNYLR